MRGMNPVNELNGEDQDGMASLDERLSGMLV
jgi:hypothetical protein